MITILHRRGYAQMITILHRGGGGSLRTPKSDYVICARPLSSITFTFHWYLETSETEATAAQKSV